jgi:hypothetical protein
VPLTRRSAVIALLAVVTFSGIYAVTRSRRDLWDFEVYRTAAARALAAEPLYRPEDGHYQFKYWPTFAMAMAPFALLPIELAKATWFALSVGLLVFFVRLTIAHLPDRRHSVAWLAGWLVLVTAKFAVKELVNGQPNALLGVMVLAAALAAGSRRGARSGLLLGGAAFVKPYALLFVPWAAACRGLPAFAAAALTLTAGLMLPAILYGWDGNLGLLTRWSETVSETTPANLLFPENISFASFWAKWLGPGTLASSLAVLTAIGALASVLRVWQQRSRVAEPAWLEVGLLLLLVPLLTPQGWDYMLLLGLPIFAVVLDRYGELPRHWQIVVAAAIACTSFTVFDLLGRGLYGRAMAAGVVTVGAGLLAAAAVHLRGRALA